MHFSPKPARGSAALKGEHAYLWLDWKFTACLMESISGCPWFRFHCRNHYVNCTVHLSSQIHVIALSWRAEACNYPHAERRWHMHIEPDSLQGHGSIWSVHLRGSHSVCHMVPNHLVRSSHWITHFCHQAHYHPTLPSMKMNNGHVALWNVDINRSYNLWGNVHQPWNSPVVFPSLSLPNLEEALPWSLKQLLWQLQR